MNGNRNTIPTYSIEEVSQTINISVGMIKQWEKDLDGILSIPRTKQGARYYTDKEIKVLAKMKELRSVNSNKKRIRSMLINELNEKITSTSPSELMEVAIQPEENNKVVKIESHSIQSNHGMLSSNVEAFYTAMEQFKQDLVNEIKNEITMNQNDLIQQVKNELNSTSIETVKEISKSIQRSNDRRKADVHEIASAISKVSEQNTESFNKLSNDINHNSNETYEKISNSILKSSETTCEKISNTILKDSEATFNKITKNIHESVKATKEENEKVLEKVSNIMKETKDEINYVSQNFDTKQEYIIETIQQLKQSQIEIQKREEIFQTMIASYREVAATKKKKKRWWQFNFKN